MKDLYGYMEAALLCYDLHSKTLKSHGFQINPYDRCIADITIKVKQCTIAWYVDDNKVSHIDEEINTKIVENYPRMLVTSQYQKGRNTSSWECT